MYQHRPDALEAAKKSPTFHPVQVAVDGLRDSPGPLPVDLDARFPGHDLSNIRLHSGANALRATEELHSRAYTVGEHIAIGRQSSTELLAHEVTHVLQQRHGTKSTDVSHERAALAIEGGGRHSPPEGDADTAPPNSQPLLAFAPNQSGATNPSHVIDWIRARNDPAAKPQEVLTALSEAHGGNKDRYFYTRTYGWVDIRHFGAAASMAISSGSASTELAGFGNEVYQWLTEWGGSYRSGFSPEDIPSNAAGAEFGDDYVGARPAENLVEALARWLTDNGALPADDASAGRTALPVSDPSFNGGTQRGSSNFSRTRSTASGAAYDQAASAGHTIEQMNDPKAWYHAQ